MMTAFVRRSGAALWLGLGLSLLLPAQASEALPEIFVMSKAEGVTTIARASDDAKLARLAKAGDPPGALWRQGLLAKAGLA